MSLNEPYTISTTGVVIPNPGIVPQAERKRFSAECRQRILEEGDHVPKPPRSAPTRRTAELGKGS